MWQMMEANWREEIHNLHDRQRREYTHLLRTLHEAHVRGTLAALLAAETSPLTAPSPLRTSLPGSTDAQPDVLDTPPTPKDSAPTSLFAKAFSRLGSRVRGSAQRSSGVRIVCFCIETCLRFMLHRHSWPCRRQSQHWTP
jgi:hypothetical protein